MRGRSLLYGVTGGRYDGMICVEGHPELGCVMTDLEGKFQICAPSGAEFGLRLKKPGYENSLYLHGPGSTGAVNDLYNVGDDATVRDKVWMPISAMYPPDATHGHVALVITKLDALQNLVGVANASVSILPVNGLTVRYTNDIGEADPTLNATSAAGVVIIGDIPLGDYDIQVNGATGCAPASGGYASPDNSQNARISIAPATTTVMILKCM